MALPPYLQHAATLRGSEFGATTNPVQTADARRATRTSAQDRDRGGYGGCIALVARLLGWNRVRNAPGHEIGAACHPMAKNRVLYVNDVHRSQEFSEYMHRQYHAERSHDNLVCTSKYTMLNFVPKSLFEQFRRVANFYFLVISLLQLFTKLSPTNEYSTIGPLTIVLFATMVKEGMEDRHRHHQDFIVNHQRVDVLETAVERMAQGSGRDKAGKSQTQSAQGEQDTSEGTITPANFQTLFWKQLRVGHVIRIADNEQVPADVVLLFSSQEMAEAMCETSSLDGESNLKVRQSVKWNQIAPRSIEDLGTALQAELRCDLPNKRLYNFDGVLRVSYASEAAKKQAHAQAQANPLNSSGTSTSTRRSGAPLPDVDEIPISIENVLLRGMKLCNTKWAVGVVVGAGNDSKLMQNMKAIPSKFSRLDHVANRCIFLIFTVLFVVCFISSIQSALFSMRVHADPGLISAMPYVPSFQVGQFIEIWLTYLILYNNMVPISLYISLEVVKWYQARRIEDDPLLKDTKTGHGVTARTSNVNEDLGQIKYIFSDKTGTLTRNQMLFKVCSIGGIIYDGSDMKLRRVAQSLEDHKSQGNNSAKATDTPIAPGSSYPMQDKSFLDEPSQSIPLRPASGGGGSHGIVGANGNGNGNHNGTSSADTRRSQPTSLSDKDIRPFHHLAKMVADTSAKTGTNCSYSDTEQRSLALARPFFRCLLLCHSASVAITDAVISPPVTSPQPAQPPVTTTSFSTVPREKSLQRERTDDSTNSQVSDASVLGPLPERSFGTSANGREFLAAKSQHLRTQHRTNMKAASKPFNDPGISVKPSTPIPPDTPTTPPYFGSSPDEVALLNAATEFQCVFEARDGDLLHVRIFGQQETYRVLALNEFDSVRKCMSVVVQRVYQRRRRQPDRDTDYHRSTTGGDDRTPSQRNEPIPNGSDSALSDWENALSDGVVESAMTNKDGEEMSEDDEDGNRWEPRDDDECTEDEGILVFCKGADTVMLANAAASAHDLSKLGLHVHYFAAMALRTLLLGYRKLSKPAYKSWKCEYDTAKKSLADREQRCVAAARTVEASITLLGATGVEDLLQDGVRECIDQLVQAGVNVWMLTGDKDETAISVAHMCGLIGEKGNIVVIKGKNKQDCLDDIANARRKLKREGIWNPGLASRSISLVINGEALDYILASTMGTDATTSSPPKNPPGSVVGTAGNISNSSLSSSALPTMSQHQHQQHHTPFLTGCMVEPMDQDALHRTDTFARQDADAPSTQANTRRTLVRDSSTTKSTGLLALNDQGINSNDSRPSPHGTTSAGDHANGDGGFSGTASGSAAAAGRNRAASRNTTTRGSLTDGSHVVQQPHELFMELATQCSSVIACRLSPMQKAQVVGLMKSAPGAPLTLAVGDGGNDVSMIQEAHVGIGIYGHEGMQAVRAADFAIATFRHLSRLLLVHGRWNHRRVARVILFSFYKNMALIMTLFAYSQTNGYSGQTLYESYLMVGWNVLYTLLPIFVLGIVDEDIRDSAVLRYPFVYRSSLKDSELGMKKLSLWVFNALLHSQLVFFFTTRSLTGTPSVNGHANGLFTDGTAVYGALIITVTLKAMLTMQSLHRWTRAHYVTLVGGFLAFLVFVTSYSHAYSLFPTFDVFRDFEGIATMLFSEGQYWITLILTSVACIAPDIASTYLRQMYLPTGDDIIREIDSGLGQHFAISRTDDGSSPVTGVIPIPARGTSKRMDQISSSRSDDLILRGNHCDAQMDSHRDRGRDVKGVHGGRGDLTSSLIDGEWSQKFRDFDRPSEHDELSKQLIALQREIAQEIGLPDPLLGNEEDGQSSRALSMQPNVHPITLEFMGEQFQRLENEYALTLAFRERLRVILYLKILAFVIPLYAVYEYFWEGESSYVWIRGGYFVCDLLYMRFVRTRFFLEYYQSALLVPFWVIGMALTFTISDTGKFAAALYPIVLFVVVRVKFLYALLLSIFNGAFYLLADKLGIKQDASYAQDLPDLLLFSLYMAFVIAFGGYSCYSLELTMRRDFLQSRSLLIEQKRSTQILKNMLPEHVVQRMQRGDTLISEDEKDVTILFCDIADFASVVQRFSPTEVVTLLDRVYSLFDQICQKHGVRKMETVGKTYMACAGLQGNNRGREAALRAVCMAIDMLANLNRCQASNGGEIKLRLGIHSGRVISGLVGMKKQQFSLFGDTVNTASRMQSTGVTGRCQVSQVTYKKISGHFTFEERQIQAKGKGTMTTYMLGEPITELARMAVAGRLEHILKRESVVAVEHTGATNGSWQRPFDPEFLSATRHKIMQNARRRVERYDIVRWLLGSPPNSPADLGNNLNLGAISDIEQDMIPEIHSAQLRFKDADMEYKYLENTLGDRVEGAHTTLLALAGYAIFACLRDLTIELLRSNAKVHGATYVVAPETYIVLLGTRIIYAVPAVLLARRARTEFPDYSDFKLRNVLMVLYMVGLVSFVVPEMLLWRLNFVMLIDASSRYTNLCLDTVLAMFVVSNGGSVLHRHSVTFNVSVLGIVTLISLVSLRVYHQGPEDASIIEGYNARFKTSYPLVLTYLSVVTNVIASQSVEFFTRRRIWLKTRTQMETMNADRLLYQMLPAAVVMRLKEGETVCDQHQQVGILFSDIKGFTSIASQAKPAQVVNILASLFCAFDKLTEKHGVFKMQTIGDAYVIVSGLPYVDMSLGPINTMGGSVNASLNASMIGIPPSRASTMSTETIAVGNGGDTSGALFTVPRAPSSRVLPLSQSAELGNMVAERQGNGNGMLARRSTLKRKFQMQTHSHIRDLLAMARDMHKEVRKVKDPNTGERLQMRIGIHIGNIIGGVIGTSTLRYDMWGPDQLTANELESNGEPERTLVSPMVVDVVQGMPDIRCTFHKKINFTNVNMMDTYFVDFIEPPACDTDGDNNTFPVAPIGSVNVHESPEKEKSNRSPGAGGVSEPVGSFVSSIKAQGSLRAMLSTGRGADTSNSNDANAAQHGSGLISSIGVSQTGTTRAGLEPIRDD